jgi:hypothetical protein
LAKEIKTYIHEPVGRPELSALAHLAREEERAFFERNPHLLKPYRNRLVAAALCQGAALQYLGCVPFLVDFQRSFPSRRVDLKLRSPYHDLDVLFNVNPARVSDSAFEDPLRATISV